MTQDGLHVSEGVTVAPKWSWHMRISARYLSGLALADRARQVRGDLAIGLGLPAHLEIAMALPAGTTFDAREEPGRTAQPRRFVGLGREGSSAGDLSATLMWSPIDVGLRGFGVLIAFRATAPTGDNRALMGEGRYTLDPFAAIAVDFFGTRLLVNLGYRVRPEHAAIVRGRRYEQDDELIWRVGLRVSQRHDVAWSIEAEGGIGMVTFEGPWPSRESRPVSIAGGVDLPAGSHYRVGLHVGAGVVGAAVPSLALGLSFSWLPIAQDPDGDGISGSRDRCPMLKEDVDGFEDGDGCPDPDNDGDGFPDDEDLCPLQPGGDFSEDGC